MNFHTHNPMSRLMKSQIKEPRARALLFFNLNIDNESYVQVIDTTIDSHVTIRSFKRLLPPYLKIVKNVKFPFWNVLLLIVGMSLGMHAEKCLHNMVFEEITELLFYASLMGIIWLYGFNKDFQIEDNI